MWKDVREIPMDEIVEQYMKDTKCEDRNLAVEMCAKTRNEWVDSQKKLLLDAGWKIVGIDGWLPPEPNSLQGCLGLADAIKMQEIFKQWTME